MALAQIVNEKAGSVGASWPPRYDAHNNRIKGFCTRPIGSLGEAHRMLAMMRDVEAAHPQSTRTTVRAFMRQGLVEGLAESEFAVEARVPAHNALPGHELVYFGRNSLERLPDREVLRSEMARAMMLDCIDGIDARDALRRVTEAGYSISPLNGARLQAVEDLLVLYREAYQEYTFVISHGTITEILGNGNLVIAGTDGRGAIVSSLIAEHVRLGLENGVSVDLYELSDYATLRAHRGNGLMTLMQIEAIRAIREAEGGGKSIIYAEDRAPWTAVNRSSAKAGMSYYGTLLQHCVLVSDRDFAETGRYENLNVWAHVPE